MEQKIWTADELMAMTPAERSAISKAAVVRDPSEFPELLEQARETARQHMAARRSGALPERSWPVEQILRLRPDQFTTFMSYIRERDYDAIDMLLS